MLVIDPLIEGHEGLIPDVRFRYIMDKFASVSEVYKRLGLVDCLRMINLGTNQCSSHAGQTSSRHS